MVEEEEREYSTWIYQHAWRPRRCAEVDFSPPLIGGRAMSCDVSRRVTSSHGIIETLVDISASCLMQSDALRIHTPRSSGDSGVHSDMSSTLTLDRTSGQMLNINLGEAKEMRIQQNEEHLWISDTLIHSR